MKPLQSGTAMLLALVSACAAGLPLKPAPEPAAVLPAIASLDALKAPSWLQSSRVPAALPVACSGVMLDYSVNFAGLLLEDPAAGCAWAVYRLTPPEDGAPLSLVATGSGAVWMLAADYLAQRWEVLGQLTNGVPVEFDLAAIGDLQSPGGGIYIAALKEPPMSGWLYDLALAGAAAEDPGQSYFYVARNGDDFWEGSAENPWYTLQHAADMVQPGDTVIVRAGTYTGFDIRVAAIADALVRFMAEPGVRIAYPNEVTGQDGINIENAAYVVVSGFSVEGMPRAGIRAAVSDHITVQDCSCFDNGVWGIFSGFAENFTLERNVCVESDEQHGIYVSNSSDHPLVRGNVLAGNAACGLHMNGDISMGGDGVISFAVVEGNVVFDNGTAGGSGINCDGVQDSLIQNNLLYLNHASGISLYQIDGGAPSTGNTVRNNTVVQAEDGRWCMNLINAAVDNNVVNNIFYTWHNWRGSLRYDADSLAGLFSDNNIIFDRITIDDGSSVISRAQWQADSGQDAHSIIVDETQFNQLFVQSLLQPGTGSPALNAGSVDDAPPTDIAGALRPQGSGVDIGAWEYAE